MRDYETLRGLYKSTCVFCTVDPRVAIWRGTEVQVCFDASPLVPGHLILSTVRHVGCAGEVPRAYFDELVAARSVVAAALTARFGAVSFYEHGRAGHCLADESDNRLCHHFHLHCVPLAVDISGELSRRFDEARLHAWPEIVDVYEEYGNYLYAAAGPDDVGRFWAADESVEPHLLRTLIAQRVGLESRADWQAADSEAVLDESLQAVPAAELANALDACLRVTT
jgi:diadenosine tetraphosphate (Ap4A) HIT family hydrolase